MLPGPLAYGFPDTQYVLSGPHGWFSSIAIEDLNQEKLKM
jgi:hypothetical protein